ncbi:hypothetical protein ABZ816_09085 [Actinosynnema sp. NPDC047251]|uniref:Uncharacterized protein n=1 Tax=Saccharothrix espanaensis (strain ATCC 51144 / DSM 44229 / JCM 9112 / NBRC 15066 / NRRL 15764) TaxID=1179773 RepID=K0K154_SACES|nr:hypothetical protein [Saccharothrix espanaensis]CCH33965.1 hypothetical protein BN6_67280 [Saccharothrix espanaensis DSM 44229]
MRLAPVRRKTLLLLHVVSSVGWLGVTAGNLVLALVAFDRPVLYQAMELLGDYVVLPMGLLSLVTGVLVAVGTKWGLIRYRWVLVKLITTVVALVATVFALRSGLHAAAAGESGAGADVLVASCVSLTIYTVNTVLSVFKPWGRTRWG